MGDISITFADGEVIYFPPLPDSNVLIAAERAGNKLAHNCRQGICRSCAALISNGEDVLLCIEPARNDFKATVPYRRADVSQATTRRAKINSFAKVSQSVWEIRYRLQFPLPFLAGQFIEANFPGIEGPRRFSMANTPTETEQILHVRDIAGGAMSTYLNVRAKPQDLFTVRGPFGIFYLRATRKPKLFVSGGTGLAPIMSMLKSIDRNTAPPLTLIAGFTASGDAYGIDELRKLEEELPLKIILTAEKPDAEWQGLSANSVQAVQALSLSAETEAYLCGPPGMVLAARQALLELGVAKEEIFNEEFSHILTK